MSKFIKLLLLLFLPTLLVGQSAQRWNIAIQKNSGSNYSVIVPNAQVYVCQYNAQLQCNTPVAIYSDSSLTRFIPQPLSANAAGTYGYFIQSGTQVVEKVCAPYNQCSFYGLQVGDNVNGGQTVVEVNGTPASPVSPVNFVNSSTVTFSILGNQISAAAAAGVTTAQGVAPIQINGDSTNPHTGNITIACLNAGVGIIGCGRGDGSTIASVNGVFSLIPGASSVTEQGTSPITVNGDNAPHTSNSFTIACSGCGPTSYLPLYTPPSSGAHVLVYPNAPTVVQNGVNGFAGGSPTTSGASAGSGFAMCTSSAPLVPCGGVGFGASVTWNFTLPSYINPTNINAMYLHGTSTGIPTNGIVSASCTGTGSSTFPVNLIPAGTPAGGAWPQTDVTIAMATPSSVNVGSISCEITAAMTGSHQHGPAALVDLNSLFLDIYDSVDTLPAQSYTNILYPLSWQGWDNSITLFLPYLATPDNGTSSAYASANPAFPTQLLPGTDFWILPANNNSVTNPTLAMNGGNAFPITKLGGSPALNDIVAGQYAHFIFDGLNYQLQNPQTGSGGSSALTMNNGGSGASSGTTFNGSTPITLSYNTIGAAGISGTPTTGHCANWASANTLGDAGAACGSGGGSGYTNVTGSIAETTVAQINTDCGSGTFYATTPLSIATGGTVTCAGVQFSKAGLWTIASGQTVTFSHLITETDGPHQHFNGSGLVIYAAGQTAYPEWQGAVGDWTSGTSGTDNHAPIGAAITSLSTNGGTVQFQALGYYLGTVCALAPNASGVNLNGTGNGDVGNWTGTKLACGSTSADIIDVGTTAANIWGSNVTNLELIRSSSGAPSGTSKGLSVSRCIGCIVDTVASNDSITPFYTTGSGAGGIGRFTNLKAAWGVTGTCPAAATTVTGFSFDGVTDSLLSTRARFLEASDTCTSLNSTGYLLNTATDLTLDQPECAGTKYCVQTTGNMQDVHVSKMISDATTCSAILATSMSGQLTFNGGWAATNGTNACPGADLESSTGVTLNGGMQFKGTWTNGALLIHNGSGNYASLLNFSGCGGTCIALSSTSGNSITGNIMAPATTGISLIASSTNAITGNQCGTPTTCITADSSSNNNRYLNTNQTVSGTLLSDSGTGNQIGTSTPNALTAAATGGAAPGSTFNGSSAVTLDYHSLSAQCALTLTTTGSSGAATLGTCSGGAATLNIPQYSGGGGSGGNVTNITGSSQITASGCTQSAGTGGTCTVSGSAATSVTFSSIPGTYLNLRLVFNGNSSTSTNIVGVQFNSDTTSGHYSWTCFQEDNASGGSCSNSTSDTSIANAFLTGATTAGDMANGDFYIPAYTNTTFAKGTETRGMYFDNGTTGSYHVGGHWTGTAAITSITLICHNCVVGSTFTLYGEN